MEEVWGKRWFEKRFEIIIDLSVSGIDVLLFFEFRGELEIFFFNEIDILIFFYLDMDCFRMDDCGFWRRDDCDCLFLGSGW